MTHLRRSLRIVISWVSVVSAPLSSQASAASCFGWSWVNLIIVDYVPEIFPSALLIFSLPFWIFLRGGWVIFVICLINTFFIVFFILLIVLFVLVFVFIPTLFATFSIIIVSFRAFLVSLFLLVSFFLLICSVAFLLWLRLAKLVAWITLIQRILW